MLDLQSAFVAKIDIIDKGKTLFFKVKIGNEMATQKIIKL